MTRARAARGASLATALLLASSCAAPAAVDEEPPREDAFRRGPLPLRTNGPLVQIFPVMRPRAAATTPAGTLDLQVLSAYSSIFEVGQGATGSVSFDGELWRNSLMLRTGLGPATDVDVEIPVMYASSGFLDVFVETWHELLGLPNSGRETRERFDYDMTVRAGDDVVYELEGDRVGLGDVPVVLTHRVVEADGGRPAVYVQGLVELPTGDESDGFGNGAFDYALGAGVEWNVDDWSFGAGAHWAFRSRPTAFAEAGWETEDGLAARGDVEWRMCATSSILFGLRHERAASQSLPIEELDGDVLDLDLGVAFDTGARSVLFVGFSEGFSEDLISESSPDFTAILGFRTGF